MIVRSVIQLAHNLGREEARIVQCGKSCLQHAPIERRP